MYLILRDIIEWIDIIGITDIVHYFSGASNPMRSSSAHSNERSYQNQHSYSSGGSLLSSLKGGAASLIKNIKEQSQQYLAPTVAPNSGGNSDAPPPPRPAPPPNRPPPPRPAPPSPQMNQRKKSIEFENKEYEAMNPVPPSRPLPPRPRPPSPREPEQPKVANLLDMSFDSGPEPSSQLPPVSSQSSAGTDLLEDLFGSAPTSAQTTKTTSSASKLADDLFWVGSGSSTMNTGKSGADVGDLLGDPFASVLGGSVPTGGAAFPSHQQQNSRVPVGGFAANFGSAPSQPFLQTGSNAMPQSASFQNLNAPGVTGSGIDLLGVGPVNNSSTGKIPKNSSSPNLLSDMILDDIIGSGSSSFNKMSIGGHSGGGSNPTLAQSNTPLQQTQKVKTHLCLALRFERLFEIILFININHK